SKAESNSNVSSRAAVPEKPKVLAPGLYVMMPKYVPPQKRNNKKANTPLPRKETISLVKQTNVCVNLSTGIKSITEASKSKSKNRVDSSLRVKRTGFNLKSVSVCKTCNECLVFGNHNKCGVKNLNSVNAKNPKVNNDATVKQVWKATGKIFASVGSKWRPTGRKFTLGDTCPLTRITKPEVVPLEKSGSVSTSEPANNVIVTPRFSKKPLTSYKRKDRKLKDISTGSPPNTETKAVNDPVNVNDLSANQLDPNKNWVSDVPNSTASSVFQCRSYRSSFDRIGLDFIRTKDETPEVNREDSSYKQRALNATVRFLRTDNGTEFVNKTLIEFCESVGITYNTSVPQTPQQNGVVERRNQTLIEAARTMLIFAKAPMFLWAEAVATACYTLNRSLVHTLHGKTYYELLKGKKPEVKYFRVFGSLCYPTNDYDDLGKLKVKADIGIFVGYAPTKKAYRIYNKRTRKIQETVHVTFDELTKGMTSAQPRRIGSGLVTTPTTPSVTPTEKQLSELFQPLFDEDKEFPLDVHPHLVNVAPPRAPEIAPDSPSTTTVTEDSPVATTITLPSQTSPPDTGVNGPENTITTSGVKSLTILS
ncbi:retrovirus-related pol polyprotein from transposon TNT 1-94, partial [Tanacetum coccineum]